MSRSSSGRQRTGESLNEAIRSRDLERVKRAFEGGAEVVNNAVNGRGFRNWAADSLYFALTVHSSEEVIKLLLKCGAQVVNDATNMSGNPYYDARTLHHALDSNANPEVIDLLLLNGASPNSLEENHPRRQEMIDRAKHLDVTTAVMISDTATALSLLSRQGVNQGNSSHSSSSAAVSPPAPPEAASEEAVTYSSLPPQPPVDSKSVAINPLSKLPEGILNEIATYSGVEGGREFNEAERSAAANFGADRVSPDGKRVATKSVKELMNKVNSKGGGGK